MSALLERPEEPGKRLSMALAVGVHAALIVFLIYGIRWQTEAPQAVEVELVRRGPAVERPAAEPAPVPSPKPAPEPKPESKVEAKPPLKPDIAVKEKPKPPEPKPEPRRDSMLDKLSKELGRLTETSKIDKAEKELAQFKASQAASARSKAVDGYVGKIKGKIRGNLVLPPDVKGNPEAVFDVTQLPSGEVLSARLRKSSGNAAVDAAIERAILKSSPLPQPDRADLFERELRLTFKPIED
ncbi:MAG TPA: energy transducer TonB [Rhodocyclaceae bacterium]